jgi:hypothetical protein
MTSSDAASNICQALDRHVIDSHYKPWHHVTSRAVFVWPWSLVGPMVVEKTTDNDLAGGGVENKHSTDVESTNRVREPACAFTLKVSRAPIRFGRVREPV